MIIVDNQQIIPLYDVPHLLKGIRNNLLTKNLHWQTPDGTLIAKWCDILYAYLIDEGGANIRSLPKITEFHVVKEKLKKMKVSCATQVFSHSMSAAIDLMARCGKLKLSTFKWNKLNCKECSTNV